MTTEQLFSMKCERIKHLTGEALAVADMFAAFKYHRPNMSYYDTLQAARNMRACADVLDRLAEKIAPPVNQLIAAE